jgi:hypothetical protein
MNIVKSVVLVTWILGMFGMKNLQIIIILAIKIALSFRKEGYFICRWKYRSFVPCWEISGFKLPHQFLILPSFMLSISA